MYSGLHVRFGHLGHPIRFEIEVRRSGNSARPKVDMWASDIPVRLWLRVLGKPPVIYFGENVYWHASALSSYMCASVIPDIPFALRPTSGVRASLPEQKLTCELRTSRVRLWSRVTGNPAEMYSGMYVLCLATCALQSSQTSHSLYDRCQVFGPKPKVEMCASGIPVSALKYYAFPVIRR